MTSHESPACSGTFGSSRARSGAVQLSSIFSAPVIMTGPKLVPLDPVGDLAAGVADQPGDLLNRQIAERFHAVLQHQERSATRMSRKRHKHL